MNTHVYDENYANLSKYLPVFVHSDVKDTSLTHRDTFSIHQHGTEGTEVSGDVRSLLLVTVEVSQSRITKSSFGSTIAKIAL